MYSNILVAIDLSDSGQGGALIARAQALLDDGGKLRLLHVLEEVPTYALAALPRDLGEKRKAAAEGELRALAETLGLGGSAAMEVRSGAPSSLILQRAEATGADLVMIASHRPGLGDYFIGSTAARVVRHAQCSVLVTR